MPIRKVKGGWKIDRVAGVAKTRAAALKRLRAVKAAPASPAGKQARRQGR